MIAEFSARYVIVGHSERRGAYGETDGMIDHDSCAGIECAKVDESRLAGLNETGARACGPNWLRIAGAITKD